MTAMILESEGGMLWLVAVLLMLAVGLAGALLAATRGGAAARATSTSTGTGRAAGRRLS
jgi:UPF0716 family protein affecting phage T7 exclusion